MSGYDTYDIVWRQYYPAIMRFQTPDPEAEKYYSLSPYTMCGDNMVLNTDPDGRDIWDFVPLVGSGRDIFNGIKNGDNATLAIGVVGLVADVATLGESSIEEGIIKSGVKEVTKEVAEKEVKQAVKSEFKEATERGLKNEAKVLEDMKVPKNNKTFSVKDPKTGKQINVKPDGIDKSKVLEIKDTKRVSDTKQIRGEREVARQQGKKFKIATGKKTHVSKKIPESELIRRKDIGPK
jgi:hypothetical protein